MNQHWDTEPELHQKYERLAKGSTATASVYDGELDSRYTNIHKESEVYLKSYKEIQR
jgi:hypothetical protein